MQRVRIWGAVLGLVLLGSLVVANVTGYLPIPVGPLGARFEGEDLATLTTPHDADASPIYLVPFVVNCGPVDVRIDRVVPTGVTVPGSVDVLGSLPFDRGDPAEAGADGIHSIVGFIGPDLTAPWADPEPVAGATLSPVADDVDAGRAFLVRVTPDPLLETHVDHVDVEYSIGPFRFVTSAGSAAGTTVTMCGPDRPFVDDGCVSGP